MKKYIALLFTLVMLACLSAAPAYAADQYVDGSQQGNDTQAIQTAVNNATGGTESSPAHVYLDPWDGTDSSCYTVSRNSGASAVEFGSGDQHIIVESNVEGQKACILRASTPTGGNGDGTSLIYYFDIVSNGASDIRFDDLRVDGQENVGGHVDNATVGRDADIAFVSKPGGVGDAIGEGDDFSLKIDGVTLTDIDIVDLFGTCTHFHYTKDINMSNVQCLDPVRGGFEFAQGAWGGETAGTRGTLTNLKATLTGDDAIAFNSCFKSKEQKQCGFAGGFNIYGNYTDDNTSTSVFGVDPEDRQGNSLMFRSAHDVTFDEVFAYRAGIGIENSYVSNPSGAKEGAAQFEDACYDNTDDKVCDGDFGANKDILIEGGELDGVGVSNGAFFDNVTNQENIVIRDNRIQYNATTTQYGGPFCGIKISANSDPGEISFGGGQGLPNTYVPNNSTRNVCDNR